MYINKMLIRNIGPIEKFEYDFKIENEQPFPTVIMGSNGSGKTILSSYIGDWIIEMAKKSYRNVVETENAYLRIVGGTNVGNYNSYGYSIIQFKDEESEYNCVVKSGYVEIKKKNL